MNSYTGDDYAGDDYTVDDYTGDDHTGDDHTGDDYTPKFPLHAIRVATSISSKASKTLPASDQVRITTGWPTCDTCIARLDCNGASVTLLDLATVSKIVHDASTTYQLLGRNCFWYSDVIVAVLQRKFPKIQVQPIKCPSRLIIQDVLAGTYWKIPIHLREEAIIETLAQTFAERLPHNEFLVCFLSFISL